jgi:putative transposase
VPQSFTKLLFHVVFSTKNREPWITSVWRPDLYSFIGGVVRNRNGEVLAVGGVADHLHLLLRLSPIRAPADVVRDIKSNSCGWLHGRNVLPFAWQDGYGAFTVSPSAVARVRAYIENQEAHHANHTFADERLALLTAAGATAEEMAAWE